MPVTPIEERGYAVPSLLVDTDWLAAHITDPTLRLIDARSAALYAAGHIPGAVNLAAHGGIPRAANADMGSPEDFSKLAGELGVGASAKVVVYDAPGAQMGAVAWAFLYYGHRDVAVLDGGFENWTQEGRATSTEASEYPAAQFTPELADDIYCSLDHAQSAQGSAGTIFWDVRSEAEYTGTQANNNTRPGHVPGAINLEWTELLDPVSRTFKPAPELREMLGSRGITPESEINCY